MNSKPNLGFIGLGLMGRPMCLRLKDLENAAALAKKLDLQLPMASSAPSATSSLRRRARRRWIRRC
ncbi:MAG: hypothetical protein ACREUS_02415 [Burkholderiales bacterium]